jgi:hypothetical protein
MLHFRLFSANNTGTASDLNICYDPVSCLVTSVDHFQLWGTRHAGHFITCGWLPVPVRSKSYITKSFLVCVLKPCRLLHVVPWPMVKQALFLLDPQVKVSLDYSELLTPRHGVATPDACTFEWSHNWGIREVWLRWFQRILLFTFCNHDMAALYHVRVCRTANKLGHASCLLCPKGCQCHYVLELEFALFSFRWQIMTSGWMQAEGRKTSH